MGKVIMSGIVPTLKAPSTGILAQDIAVGSVVKLMEGGTAVEYLVVNQGIPSNSNLYDASCDGTWLLRKDIHNITRGWDIADVNKYEISTINTWLNGGYFSSLGTVEQATIKQVKIPYRKDGGSGGSDQSGVNGLLCKIFLLGGYEVGFTTSDRRYLPVDGAKLSYFESGFGTSASNKRIANLNGLATAWWFRSPYRNDTNSAWLATDTGGCNSIIVSIENGIRPALVIPGNARFDETTMLLKGVK